MNKRHTSSDKIQRTREQRLHGSDRFWQQEPDFTFEAGPGPIFQQALNEPNAVVELCTALKLRKYRRAARFMRAVAFFEFQAKVFESAGDHENLARDARLLVTMRILANFKNESPDSPEYIALSTLIGRSGSWRSILNCRNVKAFDHEMASAIRQADATGIMVDTLHRLEVLKPESQKANIKLARAVAGDSGLHGLSDGNLRKRFRQPASSIIFQYLLTRQFPSLLPVKIGNSHFVRDLLYQTNPTSMQLLFVAYEYVRKVLGKKLPTAREFDVSKFNGMEFRPQLKPFSAKELQAIAQYIKK